MTTDFAPISPSGSSFIAPGFADELRDKAKSLGLLPPEQPLGSELQSKMDSVSSLRRQRRGHIDDDITFLALVEREDGSLTWREGLGAREPSPSGKRRGRRGFVSALPGRIAALFKTERLSVNQIGKYLSDLDNDLTPNPGLRELQLSQFRNLPDTMAPASKGRILLFIHGTFSNGEMFLNQLEATQSGKDFLVAARKKYAQILAFDHPTLSMSPVLNGLDLARRFAGSGASVDIVTHSRGGLVTRWWLEGFAGASVARRVVLVGSPLNGTSLAAPHRLRSALDFLTTVGNMLKRVSAAASIYAPFMTVGIGLARIFTAVTSVAARTPLADAAIAMVPGLCCQSRVDNNFELQRLRVNGSSKLTPNYYFVRANFEPDPVGWKFWRRFVNWRGELVNAGADLVFGRSDDPDAMNDLVVNTSSMDSLHDPTPPIKPDHLLDFGTTGRVHHCNYFLQPETVKFLSDTLLPE
jgi:pimeloyl-ACP methyl ester carboxylesterase